MAGGGPHAQTTSSPAGGRGVLAEAVGSMWSALVLGLIAAIFAWLWFGDSGECEDKGATAASQPGAKPVSTATKEVDGEEPAPAGCIVQSEEIKGGVEVEKSASKVAKCQSHSNAERATEIILEPEGTDICNTKASFSSNQDFPLKVDTTLSDQCDKNEKDNVDQRAPESGPAPDSVYQPDFSEHLQLEVATSAVEVVQQSAHKSMLDILQSAEEARSSVQNINSSEKVKFAVWEEPNAVHIADGHSTVQETMYCAVSTIAAAQFSMQKNELNVVHVGESAQIGMQEGILNATQAVCGAWCSVQEAMLEASPIAETEQCSMHEELLSNVPIKEADQSSVQKTALHATPSAKAMQSSEQAKASLLNDDTTSESAAEPTVQKKTEAAALQIDEAMSMETVFSGILAAEAPLCSMQDSALVIIPSDEEQPIMREGVPDAIILSPEEKQLGGQEVVFDATLTDEEPGHSLPEGGEAAKFSGQDSSAPEEAVLIVQHDLLSFLPTAPAVHINQVEYDLIHTEAADCSVQEAVPDNIEVAQFSVQDKMLKTSQGLEAMKFVPGILSTSEEAQHTDLDRAAQSNALVAVWTVEHQDKMSKTEELDTQGLLLHTVRQKLADYGAQEEIVSGACEDVRAQTNSNSTSSLAGEECISHTSRLSSDNCKQYTAEPQLQNQEGDSKMRKIAAVTPMPQNVSIKFRVHYITHSDSQLIAVTGNHESLGEWDVFVPLKPDKDGFWSDSVLLPVDSSVEWKFVMVENGKVKRWEECNNRSLKTGHDDAEAHQWWGYH